MASLNMSSFRCTLFTSRTVADLLGISYGKILKNG